MPVDFVKTQVQKFSEVEGMKLFEAMKHFVRTEKRVSVLFAGSSIRLLQYGIHASVTVSLIDYITK